MYPSKSEIRESCLVTSDANQAEFDPHTLPWIDRENFELDLGKHILAGLITPNEARTLREWRNNGAVVMQKLIPEDTIDALHSHYDRLWQERPLCRVQVNGIPRYICDINSRIDAGMSARVLDFHNISAAAKAIMFHPAITRFMRLILQDVPVGMQSLFFEYGSEQPLHQDFVFVTSKFLSHLIGVWVALEDVGPEQGPLLYLPGSHHIRKFNFGDGKLYFDETNRHRANAWQAHLNEEVARLSRPAIPFLAKKGDVIFWHSALVHGGSPILNRSATRKSFVIHYSSQASYRRDYRNKDLEPEIIKINDAVTYRWVHPEHIEDRYGL